MDGIGVGVPEASTTSGLGEFTVGSGVLAVAGVCPANVAGTLGLAVGGLGARVRGGEGAGTGAGCPQAVITAKMSDADPRTNVLASITVRV